MRKFKENEKQKFLEHNKRRIKKIEDPGALQKKQEGTKTTSFIGFIENDHMISLQILPPSEIFGHFQGGDLYKIPIRAEPAAGFLRKLILPSKLL